MSAHRRVTRLFLALVVLSISPAISTAAPSYSIIPLGFDDLEHTRNDGYRYTLGQFLNEGGQVAGYSKRYNGGSADMGSSAWLYDGASLLSLGLTGPEFTRGDGYKYGRAEGLNNTGEVAGYSQRYSDSDGDLGTSAWLYTGATTIEIGLIGPEYTSVGGDSRHNLPHRLNSAGQVIGNASNFNGSFSDFAWLYDGTTTVDIGLKDAEHTNNSDAKRSMPELLNEAGQVAGSAYRYNGGNANLGRSAWFYSGSSTFKIGLTGPEHTRSDGYKYSVASQMNEAGHVIGYSDRYDGGNSKSGQSAWIYNGATTLDIGLTDSEHTRSDGYRFSAFAENDVDLDNLNKSGQVYGYSARYDGATGLGRTAWFFNGSSIINIGLTGSEFTRDDGYKYSEASELNEAGELVGASRRYSGGHGDLGYAAWFHGSGSTVEIGLLGSEFTRNDGYRFASAIDLNEAGQVIGVSERFDGGSASVGRSAWIYNGTTTFEIGLAGPDYSGSLGYESNSPERQNVSGQVVGYTDRLKGAAINGQDAWFYDPNLDQTFAINLSTRSDGYAFSRVDYLGNDGLVLGSYRKFDEMDNDLGLRVFMFSVAGGLRDLNLPLADGWGSLADALHTNDQGQILGHGKLSVPPGGQMAYLLTPNVPEPSVLAMAAICAPIHVACRRMRRVRRL